MATEVMDSSDDELGICGIPTAIRRDEEQEAAIEAAKRREYQVDSNVMLDKNIALKWMFSWKPFKMRVKSIQNQVTGN